MPSRAEGKNLSISIFSPLAQGGDFLYDISQDFDAWSQEVRAIGGYWQARCGFTDRIENLEDWIQNGLARHLVAYDHAANTIWEGFVNSIALSAGGLSFYVGNLLDIANRVRVIYSTTDTSVVPPIQGVTTTTAAANHLASQALYGIVEKNLSGGDTLAAIAEQMRDTYLAEYAMPETTRQLSLGPVAAEEITISVDCLGYVHWLNYEYNELAISSTQNLSDKIIAILGDDPNTFISTDYSRIASNTLQVPAFEGGNMEAWALIRGLVALGDADEDRYNFGIYANRQVVYEEAPTTLAYQQRLRDPRQQVETVIGELTHPWNVLPGRWLFFPDFLVGRSQPSDLHEDPRAMYIESVTFALPDTLQLNGGKNSTAQQRLAQWGLAGVGV